MESKREFPAGERGGRKAFEYIFEPRTKRVISSRLRRKSAHVTVLGHRNIVAVSDKGLTPRGVGEQGWYHEDTGFRPHEG
jgi:hypothetical protein